MLFQNRAGKRLEIEPNWAYRCNYIVKNVPLQLDVYIHWHITRISTGYRRLIRSNDEEEQCGDTFGNAPSRKEIGFPTAIVTARCLYMLQLLHSCTPSLWQLNRQIERGAAAALFIRLLFAFAHNKVKINSYLMSPAHSNHRIIMRQENWSFRLFAERGGEELRKKKEARNGVRDADGKREDAR